MGRCRREYARPARHQLLAPRCSARAAPKFPCRLLLGQRNPFARMHRKERRPWTEAQASAERPFSTKTTFIAQRVSSRTRSERLRPGSRRRAVNSSHLPRRPGSVTAMHPNGKKSLRGGEKRRTHLRLCWISLTTTSTIPELGSSSYPAIRITKKTPRRARFMGQNAQGGCKP